MSYYKDRQKAFMQINEVLNKAKAEKRDLSILKLTHYLTEAYPIGDSIILKRLEELKILRSDFDIVGDNLTFKKGV